jgi:hypothetical protein
VQLHVPDRAVGGGVRAEATAGQPKVEFRQRSAQCPGTCGIPVMADTGEVLTQLTSLAGQQGPGAGVRVVLVPT